MAHFRPDSSQLTLHLADRALTPIISSQQSQAQAQALSSITLAAISAYDSAARLGLGIPQRIMIETHSAGPVILHSYLSPQQVQRPQSRQDADSQRHIVEHAREGLRPLSGSTDSESAQEEAGSSKSLVNGTSHIHEATELDTQEENSTQPAPLLIASVVAPSAADLGEARRAAARLERTGRDFQREWIRDQEESRDNVALPEPDDG